MNKKDRIDLKLGILTGFIAAILGTGMSSLIFNSLGIYGGWVYFICLCLITAILGVKLYPEVKRIAKMKARRIKLKHDINKNKIG